VFAVVGFATTLVVGGQLLAAKRPNILFVITDQQSADVQLLASVKSPDAL